MSTDGEPRSPPCAASCCPTWSSAIPTPIRSAATASPSRTTTVMSRPLTRASLPPRASQRRLQGERDRRAGRDREQGLDERQRRGATATDPHVGLDDDVAGGDRDEGRHGAE